MLLDRYIHKASNLFVENRLLKFVVVVLAVMQVVSMFNLSKIEENQKTVIIPAGLSEKVEVSSTTADLTYLNAMAVYIATLRYSTTPRTVMAQYKNLLSLFTPEAYSKYSEDYLSSASAQIKNEVTYESKIENIEVQSEPEQIIIMKIIRNKYVFRDLVENNKQTELSIYYHFLYGRLMIDKIEERQQ